VPGVMYFRTVGRRLNQRFNINLSERHAVIQEPSGPEKKLRAAG
jgi:hypothetical protein